MHALADNERPLPLDDYRRYGRQMILEGFGLSGQLNLKHGSVVVVGAGGLGCPALQYLAAAGLGIIGIIDHDLVELSNLQRQILHCETRVGIPKALSAEHALRQLNSSIQIVPTVSPLNSTNAAELLRDYDIILDCTDNPATRYLLSDIAVRLGVPLVSGAAQRFEGQLCVYNLSFRLKDNDPSDHFSEINERSPCYRCIFPKPPAPESGDSCEELGILGSVTGVIGCLQAVEAIKILTGLYDSAPRMLLYSALSLTPFRSVKLRSRSPTCPACGNAESKTSRIEDTDYVAFCGGAHPDWLARGLEEGAAGERIKAQWLADVLTHSVPSENAKGKAQPLHIAKIAVLDVRPKTEFNICHLPGSINIPIKELLSNPETHLSSLGFLGGDDDGHGELYVVCRLGNDSQLAADALRQCLRERQAVNEASSNTSLLIRDVTGGLRAWSRDVDPEFPIY